MNAAYDFRAFDLCEKRRIIYRRILKVTVRDDGKISHDQLVELPTQRVVTTENFIVGEVRYRRSSQTLLSRIRSRKKTDWRVLGDDNKTCQFDLLCNLTLLAAWTGNSAFRLKLVKCFSIRLFSSFMHGHITFLTLWHLQEDKEMVHGNETFSNEKIVTFYFTLLVHSQVVMFLICFTCNFFPVSSKKKTFLLAHVLFHSATAIQTIFKMEFSITPQTIKE